MLGAPEKNMSAMQELKWLIFIIIVLWVVWFLTGGPSRSSQQGPFVSPIVSPTQEVPTYGPTR